MKLELYHDPLKGHPYLFTYGNEVDWKGTEGVGDILFGMNAVHMMTHLIRKRRPLKQMQMNVFWPHDDKFLFHFEDPETIAERGDYLHSFYHDSNAVHINHIFNSTDYEIARLRHRGFQRQAGNMQVLDGIPTWAFRHDAWCLNPNPKKVVFWRPLFNKAPPWGWKRSFDDNDWERILDILDSKGFTLTEITYRTPVREAFYHINTSRFCIFYDGMWQYIAKNLCKPVISLGDSAIAKVHSPQCLHFKKADDRRDNLFDFLIDMPNSLKRLDHVANKYRKFILSELQL